MIQSGFEQVERVLGAIYSCDNPSNAVARFNTFASDEISVLICNYPLLLNTDLNVNLVINFSLPAKQKIMFEYINKLRIFDSKCKKPKLVVNFLSSTPLDSKKLENLAKRNINMLNLEIKEE